MSRQGLSVPGLAPHIGSRVPGLHFPGGGGVSVVAPAAPLMSWASTSSDNTPNFNISYQYASGSASDIQALDHTIIQYQVAGGDWSAPTAYVDHALSSGDISTIAGGGNIAVTAVGTVADGTYAFRARNARTDGSGGWLYSAWTSDVAVTISTSVSASYSYRGNGRNDGSSSVATYSFNLDIGLSSASRRIVVVLGANGTDAWTGRSAVVNGVTLSEIAFQAGPYGNVAAFIGTVPSGDGVVTITTSVNNTNPGYWAWNIAVWRADGVSVTPVQVGTIDNPTANGPVSLTNVVAGDFIFAVADGNDYGAVNFNSSTEVPDGVRAPYNEAAVFADWQVNAGAAPFSVLANGFGPVVAVQLR